MSERLAEVRDILSRNYEEMHALIGGLADGDLDRTTANGWSVREMAGHIANSPNGDIFVMRRLRAGKSASFPSFLRWVVNIMNFQTKRKHSKASKADLLAEHEAKHNELFAYINTLSDEDLDRRGSVLSMG